MSLAMDAKSSNSKATKLIGALSELHVLKVVGNGKFSRVVLAESVDTHTKYAIKTIKVHDRPTISYQNYNSISKVQNEVRIMRLLSSAEHPNILKLFNVISKELEIAKSNKIHLVLEYCANGELNYKKLKSIDDVFSLFRQISSLVEFLHWNGIVHRDIKPSNILVCGSGDIKLSDFGISYKLTGDPTVDQFQLSSTMGTPLFMAPELCSFKDESSTRVKCKLDYKIDVWSLGVTFYYLVFREFPFHSDNEYKLFVKISQDAVKFSSIINCPIFKFTNDNHYSHGEKIKIFTNLCELIEKMLNKNESKRLSIEQVKKSEFLTYNLSDKERKSFIKFNESYMATKGHLNSNSGFKNLENAFSKLMVRSKHHRPNPITIKSSQDSPASDIPDFKIQPEDDFESDLETSSGLEDTNSTSMNNMSAHQLFMPSLELFNNSCFSLPMNDGDRLTDSLQANVPFERPLKTGINSAPITPSSPTHFSLVSGSTDDLKPLEETSRLHRSKGVHNLSHIKFSKGENDLHSILKS